jgi:hypothetical protein
MLISDYLVQSLSDMTKSVGTSFPAMTFSSSPEMTAKTSSQPAGRFAIIWRLRRAVLAKSASLFKEWTFSRNWL